MDYFYINAITLGTAGMAFLISFWLPMPQRSLFFKGNKASPMGSQSQQEGPQRPDGPEKPVIYKDEAGSGREKMEDNSTAGWCSRENMVAAGHQLWQSFRESYSSRHVVSQIYINIDHTFSADLLSTHILHQ